MAAATGRKSAPTALVAPAGAGLAAAIATLVLLRRWHEGVAMGAAPVVMVPATAAGILLAACALLLMRPARSPTMRGAGGVLAAATAVLGLAILAHYAVEWLARPGGGRLVGSDAWWAQRPSRTTGLGLAFIGVAIFALGPRRLRPWADRAAAATLIMSLLGLVGHAYGASVLYGLNPWGGTAVSTAIALAALAIGVVFADPGRGLAAVLVSEGPGGDLLRRLLPAALVAPVGLGWIALGAEKGQLVDVAFAISLLVVTLVVLLVEQLVRRSKVLHAAYLEREELAARERAARDRATDILESITDAFFAVDRQWRFTYVNREAERLLQRPRQELLGRDVWAEFPEAVGAAFQREYRRAMAEQVAVQFEEHYQPLDIWVEVRAFPTAEGLSVYFRDMTERRRAEARLRESEERYRLLADMIPQHIWTTEANGHHTYFSRRWYEYSGTTPEQSQGEGWVGALHPEDRERTMERWRHSLRTGEPYAIEYRFRNAEGSYHWFLGQAMPLRNEAGEIVRWFGTLTDISEPKRLAQEREQLLRKEQEARAEADRRRAEVERVTESRARLMRGFSHDVRNPLSVADMQAWMLEGGKLGELTERQRESVARIRRAIGSSLRLIDDLLDLSRAEAGQLDLRVEATDVGQAVREVADDFRAPAAAAGIAIDVRASDRLLVRTDATRLRQILANLLSNAVKYAPGGRLTVDAALRTAGGPDGRAWIAVRVIDSGPGIPEDKHELIFQEYTRLDPQAQQGAGIGLAISRRIARLLGGDLTVDSALGRGAAFTLWLPTGLGVVRAPEEDGRKAHDADRAPARGAARR